jgi:mannose-1-phosphate guanylyltransferase
MTNDLWSVVLAAGKGRRLASVTGGTPKQFWRADDRPSLLQATFSRLSPLVPPERNTVIIDRAHLRFVPAWGQAPWPAERIVLQPEDRGTAAGVLLALTPVLETAPDAVVVLTPSDHGIADPAQFRAGVRDAAAAVRSGDVEAVLFGAQASAPVTDYGWITPGPPYQWANGRPLRRVDGFVEKPTADHASQLFAARAVWNTMVMVARADALLALYRSHLPVLAETFGAHRRLPADEREAFLTAFYAELTPADFSRDVLTHARGLAVYTWDRSIGWSDLGTPDRLFNWHSKEPVQMSA